MNPFGCALNQNSSSDLFSAIVHTADAGSITHACITSVLLLSLPATDMLRADQSTKSQHDWPGKQRHLGCDAVLRWVKVIASKDIITAEIMLEPVTKQRGVCCVKIDV